MKKNKVIQSALVLALLFANVVLAQPVLKIGIEGILRTGLIEVSQNNGSIFLKTQLKRFTYGCSFAYENNKNTYELYLTNLPYRTDIVYTNMLSGGYLSPSNIMLYNVLYMRKLLNSTRGKFSVYVGGGLGVGHYKYFKVTHDKTGTVSIDNVVIFEDYNQGLTTYPNSMVLFPIAKLALEKKLFKNVSVSLSTSYNLKNILSSFPLETNNYWYKYQQQKTTGTAYDYGRGYQFGASLKYAFGLKRNKPTSITL